MRWQRHKRIDFVAVAVLLLWSGLIVLGVAGVATLVLR